MSQVIVTEDSLREKREKSRQQESSIEKEAAFEHWRRSDITGKDRFAALVGYAVTPVLFFWAGLTALIMLILTGVRYLFRVLGQLIGNKRPKTSR